MIARRHGWQRPLHPLQMVGIAVYSFLVTAFYCFLGLFLGNRIAEITMTTIFSFVAFSVCFLYIRCTAIDPSDKTRYRKKRKAKPKGCTKLNYGFLFSQIIIRTFRRMEHKILKTFIRRKYLDPWKGNVQMEPLIPFPLVLKDDAILPEPMEDDISFCSLCVFEVKKHSKHCRTCNRCVEGFDHHCGWLNNCIGKRNYTTFILLLIFVLLMLCIEGTTAIAIFTRCFVDGRRLEQEAARRLYMEFPRGAFAALSVLMVLVTAYGSAALGQLFFFHVVLIRKGMRTYDYILAMKEENQFKELESCSDSDSLSDDSVEPDSPEAASLTSKLMCKSQRKNPSPGSLSIKIDPKSEASILDKSRAFRASIDPWKLIKMSREKAIKAAEKVRERSTKQKQMVEHDALNPLPLEMKSGPLMNPGDKKNQGLSSTPVMSKAVIPGSPRRFSTSRRRFSGSPANNGTYRGNFDLKITEVSRELEAYISRQVMCSVIKDGTEASPR